MYNIEKVTINNPYNVSDLCSHIILDEPKMLVIDDCMPYITNYSFQFWHKSMNSGIITVTEENNTNVVDTSDEWTYFNTSFTATKISKITLQFQPGEYWIYNMKLETGTIPTDWSPHPDDSNEVTVLLEEKILHNSETIQNTISKVDANTQEILNRVDKTTYSADIELIDRQFQDADNRFSVLEDGFAKWYVEVYDKNDFQDSIDGESIESMNDMRIFGAKNSGITPQYEFMISDSSDEIYPIKIPEIIMVDQKTAKEVWASVETPTIDNYPSSEWIDKAYHDGDLYLDANSKQIYQFNNPSWTHIQENLITINQTSDINSYTKCYSWVYNKYLYYYTFVKFNDYTSATVNYNSGYGSLYLNGILKKKIDQLEDMYSNNQIVLNFSPGWNVIEIICNECTANFPDSYISDNSNCILMNCLVAMPGTRTARTTSQHAYLNIYLDHIESSVGETINQTKTDLEGKITNDITIAKSEIKQTTDAIETVVSNHTTSIEQNTQNIGKNANDIAKNNQDITTINNNYSSLVQDLNGFKTTVSSTYATTKNLSDQIKNAKDYTDSSIENFDETTQGYVANAVKNAKDYTDGAVKNVEDAAAESLQNTKEELENKIVTEIQSSESRIEQTTNAISATVSGHTVAIQKNANDIGTNSQNIISINNNYSQLIQDLNGFKTTVSSTYATTNSVANQINDIKDYADEAIQNVEASSKSYTDDAIQGVEGTSKEYVDNAVQGAQNSANSYTDSAINSSETTMKTYANNVAKSAEDTAKGYTDNIAQTVEESAKGYANNAAQNAENTAKDYADNIGQTVTTNSQNYANEAASTAESNAKQYAGQVATSAETNAKGYADTIAKQAEQRAISTSAEQTSSMFKLLVIPEEGDETSFILTDNLLEAITNQFIIKGQSGRSVIIENGQIKADSLITDILNSDILKSNNYSSGDGQIPYSVLGTFFDLSTGNLYTPSLFIDSVNKNAYFKGTIYAQNGEIGPWNINNTSIWKGSSVLSTHGNGNMYLGNNGLSLSDVLVYDSATGLLNINANSISIGSNKINNTYYYSGTPTMDTYPTTGWTDYELHINDLCYDINTNKLYKFSGYNYNMIKITFANDCSTESTNWDWLMIFYNYNGIYYRTNKYGGNGNNNTIKNAEICIPSNKFIIWWQTDSSANGYNGFRISNVSLYNGQPSTNYEVGSDINSVYSYIDSTKKTSNGITEFTMDTGVYPERDEKEYVDNENMVYYCDSGLSLTNYEWTEIQDIDIQKSSQEATNYLYWNDSTGLIINNNKKITSIDDITDQIGGNIRLTGTGIGIYNGNKLLTEYGSVTKYYNPSNNIVAAQLDSNGLSIINGSVELGTYGNSDYVFIGNNNTRNGLYLWNKLIYDANAGTLNIDVDSLNIKGKDLYSAMTNIGGNNTYFTNTIPLPSQYPSNTWVSEEEKQYHVGDICYDVSTGKIYRYQPDESNERIKITFTSESKTVNSNDVIRIYFKKNEQICRTSMLYGDWIGSYSDVIPAKNFWVHFISDSSSTAYGFKIESVSRADSDVPYSSIIENVNLPSTPCDTLPIGEYPESDHPYMNDTNKLWYVRPIINNSSYEWKEIESTAITEQIQEAVKKNNYIHYDSTNGVIIHNGLSNMPDGAWTNNDLNNLIGGNVRLVNDGLHIYKDNKEYASYGSTTYFYGYKDNGTQFTGAQINANGFLIGSTDSQYLKWDGSNLTMKVESLHIGSTDVSSALSNAANGAKTATNYLVYDSTNGLRIYADTSSQNNAYNVQIKGDGMYIRKGDTKLAKYGETTYFYSDGSTVAASLDDDNGLYIKKGKIELGDAFAAYSNGVAFNKTDAYGYYWKSTIHGKLGSIKYGFGNGVPTAWTGDRHNYNVDEIGVCFENNGNFGCGMYYNDGWVHFLVDPGNGCWVKRGYIGKWNTGDKAVFLGQSDDRAFSIFKSTDGNIGINPLYITWDGVISSTNNNVKFGRSLDVTGSIGGTDNITLTHQAATVCGLNFNTVSGQNPVFSTFYKNSGFQVKIWTGGSWNGLFFNNSSNNGHTTLYSESGTSIPTMTLNVGTGNFWVKGDINAEGKVYASLFSAWQGKGNWADNDGAFNVLNKNNTLLIKAEFNGKLRALEYPGWSDERYKDFVMMNNSYKELFMNIKPIVFKWNMIDDDRLHFGVGAQTLLKTISKLGYSNLAVVDTSDKDHYCISYNELLVLSIPIVQEHEHRIEALEKENELLKQEIQLLKQSNNVNSYLVD